jgi:hypothetical protein
MLQIYIPTPSGVISHLYLNIYTIYDITSLSLNTGGTALI